MKTCNCNKITSDDQLILSCGQSSTTWCGDDSCGSSPDYIYIDNTTNCDDNGTSNNDSYVGNDMEIAFINLDFNNSNSTGQVTSLTESNIIRYYFNTNNPENHKGNKAGWYSLNFSSPDTKITGILYKRDNYACKRAYYGDSINIAIELPYNEEYAFEVIPDTKNRVAILAEVFYSVYRVVSTKFITKETKSMTLEKGDKTVIQATDVADEERNKLVWHSSDPSIVSIDLNSGQVTAHKAGDVRITVSNTCGYSHNFTLRSVIDYVDIMPDTDGFNKVVFKSTNKVWHCINHDMIFDEMNAHNNILLQRTNLNYHSEIKNINGEYIKTYSDEELQILYNIDPYGVAFYIKTYTERRGSRRETVEEKDRIFSILTGRPPTYFAQQNDQWRPEPDNRNLDYVISESETLFGFHQMYNVTTVVQLIDTTISVFCSVLGSFEAVACGIISCVVSTIKNATKVGILLCLSKNIDTKDDIMFSIKDIIQDISDTIDDSGEKIQENQKKAEKVKDAVEMADISWAMSLVSLFENINNLFEVFDNEINFNRQIITACANNPNYEVRILSKNNKTNILREYV